MFTRRHFAAVALVLSLGLVADASGLEPQPVFEAGAATADLTPGEGVSLDGPISKPGPVRGVHDRLFARAIVMRLGQRQCALVVCDMCMIDREVFDAAKSIVKASLGIDPDHQLMAATHTHAAPRVARISRRGPDEAYRTLVAKRIAEAVVEAHQSLEPAQLGYASFQRPELVACRRFLCRPGTVQPDPFGREGARVKSVAGRGEVLRPAGPVDPQFSLISLRRPDGSLIAVLGNFSVHYCGGYAGGLVSADYFGVYCRELEKRLKADQPDASFVALMSNGTSGDAGSFPRRDEPTGPWRRMQHFGKLLAEQTHERLQTLTYHTPDSLHVAWAELPLTVRKPDDRRLAWAKKILSGEDKGPHRWSKIYATEALHLSEFPDRVDTPLQTIRIGQLAIAAAPCEVFGETGLAIKAARPGKPTIVMELANGYRGYLPTAQQHAWGGYETWPARSSHLEVDAEAKIRQRLIEMLNSSAN